MGDGWRFGCRRLAWLALPAVAAVIVLGVLRPSRPDRVRGDRSAHAGTSVLTTIYGDSELGVLLATLVRLRQDGRTDEADRLRAEIAIQLRTSDRNARSMEVHAALLFAPLPNRVGGFDGAEPGAWWIVDDSCWLAAVEMASHKAQQLAGTECMLHVLGHVPGDHRDSRAPDHSLCRSVLHLARAACEDLPTEARGRLMARCMASEWAAMCPVVAGYFVSRCTAEDAALIEGRLQALLRETEDPYLLWAVARALALAGRLDVLLAVIVDPEFAQAQIVLTGAVHGLPIDDGKTLLSELRTRALGKNKASVRMADAVRVAYGAWGKRYLEEVGSVHQLAQQMLEELGEPLLGQEREHMLALAAITGGCGLLLTEGREALQLSDNASADAVEAELADRAQQMYSSGSTSTNQLWVLAYCVRDAGRMTSVVGDILDAPRGSRAVFDATNALSVLARRGLLEDKDARQRAIELAGRMAAEARSFGPKEALVYFAEVTGASELAVVFDEQWSRRTSERERADWEALRSKIDALRQAIPK